MEISEITESFYSAFKNGDAATMASLYHDDAEFHDPAFGALKGSEIRMMWKMLIDRSKGNLMIDYSLVDTDENTAEVKWEARYTFTQTKRPVHNKITARLIFEDGKIKTHTDYFSLWKWSRQAFGIKGLLLGWTSFFRAKLQQSTRKLLRDYTGKTPDIN
jgi:ketosteroid isomerase-like protein